MGNKSEKETILELRHENVDPWEPKETPKGTRWCPAPNTRWTIRHAWEKLERKYSDGRTRVFDIYVFANARVGALGNTLSGPDIQAADRLMSANIAANGAGKGLLECAKKEVNAIIKEIPWDTTVDKATASQIAAVGNAVTSLVNVEGVRLPIATKLLFMKLPFLVPMVDSVVQTCFSTLEARSPDDQIREIIGVFKTLLNSGQNPHAIAALRARLQEEVGIDISPVRILEQLIWFDWYIERYPDSQGVHHHRAYDGWGYRPAQRDDGVCPV